MTEQPDFIDSIWDRDQTVLTVEKTGTDLAVAAYVGQARGSLIIDGGDPWHDVTTLLNGWAANNPSVYPVQYRKDAAGNLHIRGLVNTDSGTPGSTVFVLPASHRPASNTQYISCYAQTGGVATVDVQSTGNVTLRNRTGTAGQFISLKLVTPLT